MKRKIFKLILKKGISLESAEKLVPGTLLFTTTSKKTKELVVEGERETFEHLPFIESIEPYSLDIDWQEQWRLHARGFQDGLLHLDNPHLKLLPGPGFGDLSHPTTNLMLEMMPSYMAGKRVLDVGSGSGILTLAAAQLGAKEVIGIDIDPLAIEHGVNNLKLNGLQSVCRFSLEAPEGSFDVVLMNMISSEQKVAYKATYLSKVLITSGVRIEEHDAYLAWMRTFGYREKKSQEMFGWLGFILEL